MSNSRLIAKNTLFLYIRMFFTMGVSLYTSRVVLNTLGIEDYGIYVIVGGVVTLFSFFNAAMSSATQRFLSFDIGKNDNTKLKQTFNATLNIHIGIALLVLVLAETIGLWFVNYKLNVPVEKMDAVNWVYQFSIFTFLIGVIQVPYNALIIARERMNIYALFSIVEVTLKLLILYLLVISPFEKLKTYAFLILAVTFIIASFYKYYCKSNFNESKYHFFYDRGIYSTILSFTGWSLFGNIAAVARGQGSNILLNLFFGTVLNAAYGIAMQVQGAVTVFVQNFQMAVNPQIIKNYANGKTSESLKLISQSSKISFFLMFLIAYPLIYNVDFILKAWLKNPPDFTAQFTVLVLINVLIESISGPLMVGAQATGKIKWYQITIGTLIFLCLPISYLLFLYYDIPSLVFWVMIGINFLALLFRIGFLKHMLNLDILQYIKEVFFKIFIVITIVISVSYVILINLNYSNDWLSFLLSVLVITLLNLLVVFYIGLNRNERRFITEMIKNKTTKK